MMKKNRLLTLGLLLALAILPGHALAAEEAKAKVPEPDTKTSEELAAEQMTQMLDLYGKQRIMLNIKAATNIGNAFNLIPDAYGNLIKDAAEQAKKRFLIPHPFVDKMMEFYEITTASNALRLVAETSLHDLSNQILSQYAELSIPDAVNVAKKTTPNILAKGVINAYAQLYDLHVKLFCYPGMTNAPENCGIWRADANFSDRDNVINLLLDTGTWYSDVALDSLTLARAYFGAVPDKVSLSDIKNDNGTLITQQVQVARNSLQMALLDRLASYKLPVSTATEKVMGEQLSMLSDMGLASNIDVKALCAPAADGQPAKAFSQYEDRICSWVSKGNADQPGRISQSVIDQTLQHDIYLDPEFYNEAYSPAYPVDGALDRLLVMMKAQKLAQQYDFLQNFKMYVAARAMRLNPPLK